MFCGWNCYCQKLLAEYQLLAAEEEDDAAVGEDDEDEAAVDAEE